FSINLLPSTQRLHELHRSRELDRRWLVLSPSLILDLPLLQTALADVDAMGYPDQLEISKHHAWPLVAIVQQNFDAGGGELVMQLLCLCPHLGVLAPPDRRDGDLEWCDRLRPQDATRVVVLLDRGRHDARYADAVAAHLHVLRLPALVEVGRVHAFRVLGAELEDMPDLDAAADG